MLIGVGSGYIKNDRGYDYFPFVAINDGFLWVKPESDIVVGSLADFARSLSSLLDDPSRNIVAYETLPEAEAQSLFSCYEAAAAARR